MTQEEKQALLEDICERLPYGVIVQYKQKTFDPDDEYTIDVKIEIDEMLHHRLKCLDFKPYLRPLSTMTEKERAEMGREIQKDRIEPYGEIKKFGVDSLLLSTIRKSTNLQNWLNVHHFDYRDLITMGLAIEAPEGMYDENC